MSRNKRIVGMSNVIEHVVEALNRTRRDHNMLWVSGSSEEQIARGGIRLNRARAGNDNDVILEFTDGSKFRLNVQYGPYNEEF